MAVIVEPIIIAAFCQADLAGSTLDLPHHNTNRPPVKFHLSQNFINLAYSTIYSNLPHSIHNIKAA